MSENPYQAPTASLLERTEEAPRWADAPEASLGARFLNYLIDIICMQVVVFFFVLVSLILVPGTDPEGFLINYGLGLVGLIFYYVAMESVFGFTIGKLVTGTRVVSVHGGSPSFMTIFGRTLARVIPFEPLSFFSDSGGWHDTMSDTRVIKVRGLPKNGA